MLYEKAQLNGLRTQNRIRNKSLFCVAGQFGLGRYAVTVLAIGKLLTVCGVTKRPFKTFDVK